MRFLLCEFKSSGSAEVIHECRGGHSCNQKVSSWQHLSDMRGQADDVRSRGAKRTSRLGGPTSEIDDPKRAFKFWSPDEVTVDFSGILLPDPR